MEYFVLGLVTGFTLEGCYFDYGPYWKLQEQRNCSDFSDCLKVYCALNELYDGVIWSNASDLSFNREEVDINISVLMMGCHQLNDSTYYCSKASVCNNLYQCLYEYGFQQAQSEYILWEPGSHHCK